MNKIIMLGTGNGGTLNLYNTCFVIKNDNGNFLVDTGGSIEIIKRLKMVNIDLKDIKHIFISHSHTDHILGIIWMFKKLGRGAINGTIHSKINIYCNNVVYEAIMGVSKYILPEKLINGVLSVVDFHILENNDIVNINGIDYTFFDINARGTKQFGFECIMNNNRLVFLGDETLSKNLYERVMGAEYVMHEAFCLDSEERIFGAYEKHHSTVKSTCIEMNKLNIRNLILYHTEDTHLNKKELYTQEAKEYFDKNVIVPDDLEEIIID